MSKMITRTLSEEHWNRILEYLQVGLEACFDNPDDDGEEVGEIEEVIVAIKGEIKD